MIHYFGAFLNMRRLLECMSAVVNVVCCRHLCIGLLCSAFRRCLGCCAPIQLYVGFVLAAGGGKKTA